MADAEGWSLANYVEQGIARLLEAAPGPKHKAALSAGRIIYLAGRLLPKWVKRYRAFAARLHSKSALARKPT